MPQNDCLHMSVFELHLLKLICDFYLFNWFSNVFRMYIEVQHRLEMGERDRRNKRKFKGRSLE